MLKRFFGPRAPRRVLLSGLSVMPRADWKRHLESGGFLPGDRACVPSGYVLDALFAHFPRVDEAGESRPDDLLLDVCVVSHQSGEFWLADAGPISLLLLWRPKVRLAMRLTKCGSSKVVDEYTVTERMPWGEFFGRKFTIKGFLGFGSVFDARDLNALITKAASRINERVARQR